MLNRILLSAVALVAVACLAQSLVYAADATLPPGVKAVWDMSKASRETTPTSERICINGLWRWQPAGQDITPVPADNWGFFKVPGSWPGNSNWLQKDSQNVYPHDSWKGVVPSKSPAAWYQREITVPATWKDRRITLYTEYLNSFAAVYLDGIKIGDIYFPAGEVDITPAVKFGEKQVLSIYVKAAPLDAIMQAFSDTGTPKEVKGTVERPGLCGDVFLASTPKGARISDVKVDTSVRKWTIGFDVELPSLAPDKKYILKAEVSDAGQKLQTFASQPFTAADLKEGRFTFASPWHPTKLWDTNTPKNMYSVQVTLEDPAAKPLDVFRPVRFGFREFWTQGHDFYLNGSRIYLCILGTENGQLGAAWATYEAAKETYLRDMSFGVNALYTHNYGCNPGTHLGYSDILRAADDTGMLISLSQPHYGHYKWAGDTFEEAKANGYARTAEFYCRVAQNHPAVVFYSMNHNAYSYGGDDNPDLIDGKHNESGKEAPRSNQGYKHALFSQSVVAHYDPTRVIYHHSSGGLGAAYTLNLYLNFTPIQEVSDWFEHFSKESVMPLILCEFDTPYDHDWTMYRGWYQGARSFSSANLPWEYCVGEWNAQFLGDRAFNLPETEKKNIRWEAGKWRSGAKWHQWDYPQEIVGESTAGDPLKNEVRALYITDNWRAFRTYGVSATNEFGASPFWTPAKGVDIHKRQNFQVDWDNLQKPGFSPDYADPYKRMDLSLEKSDWVPGAAALALYRNNMPLLAYIGGAPEHFTAKDHNFLPGDSFTKQAIVINNSRTTQTADCSWSLSLPAPLSGSKQLTLPTGDIAFAPIALALPRDAKPGPYDLKLSVKFSSGETQTDSFIINVLAPVPMHGNDHLPPRIAIFDPKGETTKLLSASGQILDKVSADADLANYSVLIVGKNALTVDGPAPNISRVRDGLKVVMFEQTAEVLEKRFGFRVEEYGLRNAFARVPDHPLLAGLTNDNLRDWRGQSTLNPDRLLGFTLNPRTGERIKKWCGIDVTRAWRCGNWGNIASVLIEKPAKGDFLPVIDGGFSLQFSPLMVYREGKGMMLLCQLDVSGRTENDPAASRIVSNILDYVATWKPEPARTLLYFGDDSVKSFLQTAGFSPTYFAPDAPIGGPPSSLVLVLGTGTKDMLPDVAAFTKAGGSVLALALSPKELDALKIKYSNAEHVSTVFDPQPMKSLLAGVGPADVMDRDPKKIDLISSGATVLGDGVLAISPDSTIVFSQLAPWQYDYQKYYNQKRTFRRTAFLVSRVLANMGVSSPTPLLDRFSKNPGVPEPWLDSFYLDKPVEMDDPYRYFGW